MSTPGELKDVPIYRGAKWSFDFLILVEGTDTPVNLTGLGPFVCEVKDFQRDRVIATATITSNYDSTGLINVTLTPEQTRALPLGQVRMGMRDAEGNPFFEGSPEVLWFTPNPPTP